jgi:acetyl-CoA carboxylase biotin carboxyl carrier protein
MALTDEDVREILRIIDTAGTHEIRVQTEDFSLYVVRGEGGAATTRSAGADVGQPGAADVAPTAAAAAAAAANVTQAAADDEFLTIESPMLGIFYRAEAPGEPPFVEVGSIVEADTIVCIIEVMKMMNSVPAGVAGKIVAISSENGRLVEFGEPLFRVEPA